MSGIALKRDQLKRSFPVVAGMDGCEEHTLVESAKGLATK